MKKFWLCLTLLLMVLGLTACSSVQHDANTVDHWPQLSHKKEVVVGLDDSFVPMGFARKNGQLAGYDIDLARKVFKLYGMRVSFQTIDWSMNATELRNGTIDLIWNGFSITPQRQAKLAFSRPYLRNRQILVVRKNSPVKSFAQMKGKQLGMQTGSTAEQWYEGGQKLLQCGQPILYDQLPNAFLDLNSGRIQGILLDEVYARYYLAKLAKTHNYRVIVDDRVPADLFGVGMRKGDRTLQAKVNRGLVVLQKNGQLAALNKKWFGRPSNYLGRN